MKDFISIIVPIFNAEKFIHKCITSILEQTYKNFELILINDGSTDKSGEICNKFEKLDKRIITIHKENTGVSDSRNLGINKAKGPYLCFIDVDDYVENEFLSNLMKNKHADLVASGYTRLDGMHFYPNQMFYDSTLLQQTLSELINIPLLDTPWGKLFKKEIINKYNIKFDTKLKFGEDQIFVRNYLSYCNNLQVMPNAGYIYYIQPNETRKDKFHLSMEEFIYRCECERDTFKKLEAVFNCPIDTKNKMCFVSFVYDLYNNYTDEYCWELYSKYHPSITQNEYLNNTLACPINAAICDLKKMYKNGEYIKADILVNKLKHFFTIKTKHIKFSSNSNKLIHFIITHNQTILLKLLKNLHNFTNNQI